MNHAYGSSLQVSFILHNIPLIFFYDFNERIGKMFSMNNAKYFDT